MRTNNFNKLEKAGWEDGYRDARNRRDYNPRDDARAYVNSYNDGYRAAGGVVPERASA